MMLAAMRPSYSVVDLHIRDTELRRLYLNNRGTVAIKGVESPEGPTNPDLPSVILVVKGKRIHLGAEISEVDGLNNRDEAVLESRHGAVIWRRGHMVAAPEKAVNHRFFEYLGTPVGIDDTGRIVCVAEGVEGVFDVHFWPEPKEVPQDLPRPVAVAADGALCGVQSRGRFPLTEGPTAFLRFRESTTPIGFKDVLFPTCLSSVTHFVGGWSERGNPGRHRPFLWQNGTLKWLPWHQGDEDSSEVRSVNLSGVAVGRVDWTQSEPGSLTS
ncbi:MAG TPA: hypothetical protein VG944_09025, partial [Fimbriimonas sp.]|nr:hypothetical protein [Fimbriimonas sp.]